MDLLEINFEHINRHPWEQARQSIINRLLTKYTAKQDNKLNILDVGSGDAFLANGFTELPNIDNIHCVDTEYTDELRPKIHSIYNNSNLKLYANLSEVKLSNIGLITLLDVIEHVPNDNTFLNNILEQPFINDDALILISVPAYQVLFSQHDELLKHYRRYNLKSLKETLNKSNLEFIEGGYFFSTLIIPRCASLIFEKIRPKKLDQLKNLGNWDRGKTITYILKTILLIDYQIGRIFKKLKINIPGLSCYAICRKASTR